MKLVIKPDAEPVVYYTPIPVPIHWYHTVKADLERDVQLGVNKPVPIEEPMTWCHCMVVCAKTATQEKQLTFSHLTYMLPERHTTHNHHTNKCLPPRLTKRKWCQMHGTNTIVYLSEKRIDTSQRLSLGECIVTSPSLKATLLLVTVTRVGLTKLYQNSLTR